MSWLLKHIEREHSDWADQLCAMLDTPFHPAYDWRMMHEHDVPAGE